MDLYRREWPVADAKGVVGIVHGLAEHSGRYDHVGHALNDAGYAAVAFDLRGHGQSPGFPGDMGGELQPVIDDVVAFAASLNPLAPKRFLLAHSMGTLLALPAAAAMPAGTIDGLVLSGTAIVPGEAVLEALTSGGPIPPDAVSRDPEIVEAYREDPLVFYDRVPMELTMMAGEALGRAAEAVPLIAVPVLLVHGLADRICDPSASQNVHTQLVIGDKTLKMYDGLYHEVLNEPERDEVIAEIVGWLDEH